MTNMEIIETAKMFNGVSESVDTFAGWKRKGYSVKKGEHALFKEKIWKPCKSVKKKDNEEESEEVKDKKMIMVWAHFFGASQVEKR